MRGSKMHEGFLSVKAMYSGCWMFCCRCMSKLRKGHRLFVNKIFLRSFGRDLAEAHVYLKDYMRLTTRNGGTIPTQWGFNDGQSNENPPKRHKRGHLPIRYSRKYLYREPVDIIRTILSARSNNIFAYSAGQKRSSKKSSTDNDARCSATRRIIGPIGSRIITSLTPLTTIPHRLIFDAVGEKVNDNAA